MFSVRVVRKHHNVGTALGDTRGPPTGGRRNSHFVIVEKIQVAVLPFAIHSGVFVDKLMEKELATSE